MQVTRQISSSPAGFHRRMLNSRSSLISTFMLGWLLVLVVIIVWGVATSSLSQVRLANHVMLTAAILYGLWQVRRDRPLAGIVAVTTAVFVATTVIALQVGLQGPASILDRFYLPTVMAGLMLQRRALLITGAATLAVTAGLYTLQLAGVIPALDPGLTNEAQRATFQFLFVYLTLATVLDQFGSVVRDRMTREAEQDKQLRSAMAAQAETHRKLQATRRLNEEIVAGFPGLLHVIDRNATVLLSGNQNLPHAPANLPAPLTALLPDEDPADVRRWVDAAFRGRAGTRQVSVIGEDGQARVYTLRASRLKLPDEELILSVGLDTTELTQARNEIGNLNRALESRVQRITSLQQVERAITGSLDLNRTLDIILSEVTGVLGVEAASIMLYRPAQGVLGWAAGRGFTKPEELQALTTPLGTGVAGLAGQDREIRHLSTRAALERELLRWPLLQEQDFHSYMAVPLVAKDQLQGVLELFSTRPLPDDAEWRDSLDILSTQSALALENSSLYRSLQTVNADLLRAYDSTIEGWSRALDLRDHETEGHSRRVTDLTVALARRLGVSGEELVNMRRGALLHDIGKMGVPDRILLKTGKLDEDELSQMQEHPVLAREMLAPISFLQPALDIPYSHHEKWDGSGYPQGLKGEEIPRAARMFALADVYDALTSERPYRKAWTPAKALELIENEAGKHFDPELAREFVDMVRSG